MDSRRREPWVWTVGAALTSAAGYWFGTNLTPIPWLTWLAPLPALLLAARTGPGWTAAGAATGYALGSVPMWWYMSTVLHAPVPAVAGNLLASSAVATITAVGFGALLRRGRPLTALCWVPAIWVCAEFAAWRTIGQVSGANWSLAYTQADVPVLLQSVSLTGIWGLSFLIMAVPAAIATCAAPGVRFPVRAWAAGGTAAVVTAAIGYGVVRLAETPPDGSTAAAIALPDDGAASFESEPDVAEALFDRYAARVADAADRGADVAVLPEMAFRVDDPADIPGRLSQWRDLAAGNDIGIVAGLMLAVRPSGDAARNAAIYFPADGGPPVRYDKQRSGPGVGPWLVTGDTRVSVTDGPGRWGLIVCGDLDHPDIAAGYRDDGATVLLAPALENRSDPGVDAWWHSRVAITRAVSEGMSLVRPARFGTTTISDPYGRISAEDDRFAIAAIPADGAGTVYSRWGDWFAWLVLAGAVVCLVPLVRRPVRPSTVHPTSERATSDVV